MYLNIEKDLSLLQKTIKHIKEKYDNPIVWYKMNGFYETFGEDAIVTSNVLNIVLTERPDNGMKLAGFNADMLDVYLAKMVKHGNRIAIVDNV